MGGHLEWDHADFVTVLVGALQQADGSPLGRIHPVEGHRPRAYHTGGPNSQGGGGDSECNGFLQRSRSCAGGVGDMTVGQAVESGPSEGEN